jgi:uncharacterized radical SAM superfamily protein
MNSNKIYFDVPTKTKSISITGTQCSLNCAHCGGFYLKHMLDGDNIDFENLNCSSVLFSGGCKSDGSLDIVSKIPLLKELKQRNIRVNMHTGLINKQDFFQVKEYIDAVSFDFITDENTIKEVYNLNISASKYIETYSLMKEHVSVVPHICIGLNGGQIKGELETLNTLKELGAESIVFIIFIPTPNTKFEKASPPKHFRSS